MDYFGFGVGIKAAMNMFFACGRGTGRTTDMLNGLKDGDRVVLPQNHKLLTVYERMAKERGIKASFILIDPKWPQEIFCKYGSSEGRTLFSHDWLEEFYKNEIDKSIAQVDHIQKEASGYGEAHQQTKMQAEVLHKLGGHPHDW